MPWNPFRRRQPKANEPPKPITQETSVQTSQVEFPTATKVSTLEVSTSANFGDRKLSNDNLIDAAVNTSAISFPVSPKVSKVYVSTSAQWEDDPSRSRQLSALPETQGTPPPDAQKSTRQSLLDRVGGWVGRKSSRLSVTSPPVAREAYSDKLVQTSYIDISLLPKLPQLDKTTSTQGAELRLSDQQYGDIINDGQHSDLKTPPLKASATLPTSATTDLEVNTLKLDKPALVFPADKPGLFFMPGITNLPLLAPFPIPPFFPPFHFPPPPFPPLGIQSLPLIQPLKQTKPTPSRSPRKEASSPTGSSQDRPRTLHKRRGKFINGSKSGRNKDPGEGYDADFSCLPSSDLFNTEDSSSYIYKCHENLNPADSNDLYAGAEIPTQNGTFICMKHKTPAKHKTRICSARETRCDCQKDADVVKKPPFFPVSHACCPKCQCHHCCLPTSVFVPSSCRATGRTVCDSSSLGCDVTHVSASMFSSIQVCLRKSNPKKNLKVKKYNFSLETIKMLSSLFPGGRSSRLNCREVNDCDRKTECHCSDNGLLVDTTCSTTFHQASTSASCSCGAASLKQKEPTSSTFKCWSVGRHIKQLLTKFDQELADLPDRRTAECGSNDGDCGKVNNLGSCAETKCCGTQDNGIKSSSGPVTCRSCDVGFTFCYDDMFRPQSCADGRIGNQGSCIYNTCGKENMCDRVSCDNTYAQNRICDGTNCDNTCVLNRMCDMNCDSTCAQNRMCDRMNCDDTRGQNRLPYTMNCGNTCAQKNMCDNINSDKLSCYQNVIHCCGCSCECCRITENICMMTVHPPKKVCSVSSQTDITLEKTSKHTTPADAADSAPLFEPIAQDSSPAQEGTPTAAEEGTDTSATVEIVDMGADFSESDLNVEDSKDLLKQAATDEKEQNSYIARNVQQKPIVNFLNQECTLETEINSTDFKFLPRIENNMRGKSCMLKKRCTEPRNQSVRKKQPSKDDYHQIKRENTSKYHMEFRTDDNKYTSHQNQVTDEKNAEILDDEKNYIKERYTFSNKEGAALRPTDDLDDELKAEESDLEAGVQKTKKSKAAIQPSVAVTDCENESTIPRLPDAHRRNECHVHRCRDRQHEHVDNSELPVKHMKETHTNEQEKSKVSIFCAMKKKHLECKDLDDTRKREGSRHDKRGNHERDSHVESPCRICRSRPSSSANTTSPESSDVDNVTKVTPVSSEKVQEKVTPVSSEKVQEKVTPVRSEKVQEKVTPVSSEKVQEKVGIIYAMSNSKIKDTTDYRLFGNTFGYKDNPEEERTACNLPDLDSEMSNTRGQQNIIKGISEFLRTQTIKNKDYDNPNYYDSESGPYENQVTDEKNACISDDVINYIKERYTFSNEEGDVLRPTNGRDEELKIKESDPKARVHKTKKSKAAIQTSIAVTDCGNESKIPRLPDVHRRNDCHVYRCRDCQHEDVDKSELPVKHIKETHTNQQQGRQEHNNFRKSIFCAVKRKSVKIKDADILQESKNRHDGRDHYPKDDTSCPCGIYSSPPSYKDATKDVKPSDMNKPAEKHTERLKPCKICDTVSSKVQDSAGNIYGTQKSKCKDSSSGKLFGSTFSCKDNSQEESTTRDLPELDSEIELRGYQDCMDDITFLHTQPESPHPNKTLENTFPRNDYLQVKRSNTFACNIKRKHKIKSSVNTSLDVPEDNNTTQPLLGEYCRKKHNDCTSRGNFVGPTHTDNKQMKRGEREQEISNRSTPLGRNVDQSSTASIESRTFQLPNAHRCQSFENNEADSLMYHELHIHKGYISNRKQPKVAHAREKSKVSIFCAMKKKLLKSKDVDNTRKCEGSRHDERSKHEKDSHVESPCRICRSRPSSSANTTSPESSDVDNVTKVTPVSSEKVQKKVSPVSSEKVQEKVTPVSSEKVQEKVTPVRSEKVQEKVGIIYAMSNSKIKDTTDYRLFGNTFGYKDNPEEERTACNLPDLDSEMSNTQSQQNIIKGISEFLRAQAIKNKGCDNLSYYDSESGPYCFSQCFPNRCQNAVFQCSYSPNLQANGTNDPRSCACTNLGQHLLVCRPCCRQFGHNHFLCRGRQQTHLTNPSNNCVRSDKGAACQCCSLEYCRFGSHFIVRSNSNNTENSQSTTVSYLDSEKASLTKSRSSLNAIRAEQISLPDTDSSEHRFYFEGADSECKQQTPLTYGDYSEQIFHEIGPLNSPELETNSNVLSQSNEHSARGERTAQGDRLSITRILFRPNRVRLCLEQGCKHNSHRRAKNVKESPQVRNQILTEPDQEEVSINISDHTNPKKQDIGGRANHNSKRSQTDLGRTICNESNPSKHEVVISNHGDQSQSEANSNASDPIERGVSINVGLDSKVCKCELSNNVSNDRNSRPQELNSNIGLDSSPSKREQSNHISVDNSRSERELSATVSNENIQGEGELHSSASNVSDVSKQELKNTANSDCSITKQELRNIICNSTQRSQKETRTIPSNHSNRKSKENVNSLSNHCIINNRDLNETVINLNNEELNNIVTSGSVPNKQEESHDVSNCSQKREGNIICKVNTINQRDINNTVSYDGKQNQKESNNVVINETNVGEQDGSNEHSAKGERTAQGDRLSITRILFRPNRVRLCLEQGCMHNSHRRAKNVKESPEVRNQILTEPDQEEVSINISDHTNPQKQEIGGCANQKSKRSQTDLGRTIYNESNPNKHKVVISNHGNQSQSEVNSNGSDPIERGVSNNVGLASKVCKCELSNNVINDTISRPQELSNNVSNEINSRRQELSSNLGLDSKSSKRELSNNVSNDRNSRPQELSYNVSNDRNSRPQELSYNVSQDSSPSKREQSNHISVDNSRSERELSATVSNDNIQREEELHSSASNVSDVSDVSKQELRNTASSDCSITKRELRNIICNGSQSSQKETSTIPSNHSNRKSKDNVNSLSNHCIINNRDLNETVINLNNEELNNIVTSGSVPNKQEECNDVSNFSQKREGNSICKVSTINQRDINNTVSYDGKQNQKESNNVVINETSVSEQVGSKSVNYDRSSSKRKITTTVSKHKNIRHRGPSYTRVINEGWGHRDPSYTGVNNEGRSQRDPSYTGVNNERRSHGDPSYTGVNNEGRSQGDPSYTGVNNGGRSQRDPSYTGVNNERRSHGDPSYTGVNNERRSHGDPSYTGVNNERRGQRDSSYLGVKNKGRSHGDHSYIVVNNEGWSQRDPSYTGVNNEGRSHADPSYIGVNNKGRSHGDPSYIVINNEGRSQKDPSYTGVNNEGRSHRDPSYMGVNNEGRSHGDPNYTGVNNERRSQRDPSYIGVNNERRSNGDPSYTGVNNERRSQRDPSYIGVNNKGRSHGDQSYIGVNNKGRSHGDPSYIVINNERRSQKDPSYTGVNNEGRSHRDPSYIGVNNEGRSHGDPSYIGFNNERRSQRDPSYIGVNNKGRSHGYQSYIVVNNEGRSQRDPSYTGVNNERRSHGDPSYIGVNNKGRSHRDPSYIVINNEGRSQKDPRYTGVNNEGRSQRDPGYTGANIEGQSHGDPSYTGVNNEGRTHREPNYVQYYHDVRSQGGQSYVDSLDTVRSQEGPSYADSSHEVRRHRCQGFKDPNRRNRKDTHPSEAAPSHNDQKYKDPSYIHPDIKNVNQKVLSDADPKHNHPIHADPCYAQPYIKNRKHSNPSLADPNHGERTCKDPSVADPNHIDPKHKDPSGEDIDHKNQKYKYSSGEDPKSNYTKHKDPCFVQPYYKQRKHNNISDAGHTHKDRKYKDPSETDPNHGDRKYKDSNEADPNHGDRKYKDSNDAESSGHEDQKHNDLNDAAANNKDHKHKFPSVEDPNHKCMTHRDSHYVEAYHKDRKHINTNDAAPGHNNWKYKDPSGANPYHKYKKHTDSSEADPKHNYHKHTGSREADSKHSYRKHTDSSEEGRNQNYQKQKAPGDADHNPNYHKHKDPSDAEPNQIENKYGVPSDVDFMQKDLDSKHRDVSKDNINSDEDDTGQGVTDSAQSSSNERKQEDCTLSYSASLSDAGELPLETRSTIKCKVDRSMCSAQTERNALPSQTTSVHEAEASSISQAPSRTEMSKYDGPSSICCCRKKGNIKFNEISDEENSVISKKHEAVIKERCQIHEGPCFVCAGPKMMETVAQESNHPAFGSVHENKSSSTCQNFSESQGFPGKTFTTSAPQTRKRKHQTNIANPCKWHLNEVYPHFHSPVNSYLQASSSSLCQDKGKQSSKRNRSPEVFSNSFESSDALNGYPKWRAEEFPAVPDSQCQSLSSQLDDYLGVDPNQPNPSVCPSSLQCVNNKCKESSESSHRTSSSITHSFTCSNRPCYQKPCHSCGQKGFLGRRKSCCEISYTSTA
ncbi:hypothetical protein BsWGS_13944 [Bradybaena similaris]